MTKKLIKVEEKMVEIADHSQGGIQIKPLTGDEQEQILFEETALGDGLDKLLENELNKQANKAFREVLDLFRNGLKESALRSLGFEIDTWGRGLKVDHCNSRMSAVSNLISEEVRQAIENEMSAYIKQNVPSIIEATKGTILDEFKNEFVREVRYRARSNAQQAAHTFLKETMENAVKLYHESAVEAIHEAVAGTSRPVKPSKGD